MSNVGKSEDNELNHKTTFKTPPLPQQSQFSQQQYYYYYPPQVEQNEQQLRPPNSQNSNLVSPGQFAYMPVSPQQSNYPQKKNSNGKNHSSPVPNTHPGYYFPQQPIMCQYSPQPQYYMNYSPNKSPYKGSPYKSKNQQSPRKQKLSKAPRLDQSPNSNSTAPAFIKAPTKSKKYGSPNKNTDVSRMAPLTSNTNIKKKFIKVEISSYQEFLNKLDVDESNDHSTEHEFVAKINSLNCLQSTCLKLLKEPVFDILYVLKAKDFFGGANSSKNSKNTNSALSIDKLTSDINIGNDSSSYFYKFNQQVLSSDYIPSTRLDEVLHIINGTCIPTTEEPSNREAEEKAQNAVSANIKADTSTLSESNTTGTSGRMVVLNKNTNFFVSSRNGINSQSGNGDRHSNQQRQETAMMKRSLKSNNSLLPREEQSEKTSKNSTNLLGDIGEFSVSKSNGSSNFNKLIETSPKKLMLQTKSKLGHIPNTVSGTRSRNLLSKNNLVLKLEPNDQDYGNEDENSNSNDEASLSADYTGTTDMNDSSFIISHSKERAHNKKLRNLQNTSVNSNNNVSAMDLSFDGKAMNKSDLFKLIDSFEF